MEFTTHFRNMMKEREISEEWVNNCINNPDKTEIFDDGAKHYFKKYLNLITDGYA